MGRWLRVQAASALAVACAACGGPDASNAGDASVSPNDAAAPAEGGGPDGCNGCGPGVDGSVGRDGGDAATQPGVDSGGSDGGGGGPTAVSVLTYHNDNARTGQYTGETTLTPANVNSTTFGKVFSQTVDSYVYAQPLFVSGLTIAGQTHDVVVVVTENNSVYAFDADAAGPVLWHTNVGTALSDSELDDTTDLVPGAGITGTPVIDPATETMYLVSLTKDASGAHHRLHAIDLTTGGDRSGSPVEVSPTVTGTGANSQNGKIVFVPATHY